MSSRVPLVIDASTNRIVELPTIDDLDLTGSNVTSVANVTSTGDVTANSFIGDGSQISNIVAATANTVVDAVQANITQVGTLTQLDVSGNADIANIQLTEYQETVVSGGNASGTITPDASTGTIFQYTLTGNITLDSLANAVAGTSVTLILTQDGTGNRELSSNMKFASNVRTLSTDANVTDILGVFYDGTTYYASLTTGYE